MLRRGLFVCQETAQPRVGPGGFVEVRLYNR